MALYHFVGIYEPELPVLATIPEMPVLHKQGKLPLVCTR